MVLGERGSIAMAVTLMSNSTVLVSLQLAASALEGERASRVARTPSVEATRNNAVARTNR
jgi:hypothetical protein